MSLQGITSITLTDGGECYTTVPTVAFSAPTTPKKVARATAIMNAGTINQINIDSGGSYYENGSTPTVTIESSVGTTATAIAVVTNNRVSAITLTDSGQGYQSTPAVTILGPSMDPIDLVAVGEANLDSATSKLTSITIVDSGDFYTSAPSILIGEPQLFQPFLVGEYVNQDSASDGGVLTAEVAAYNDSSEILSLIHVGSANNLGSFALPSTGKYLTGQNSGATAKIVSSTQKDTVDQQNFEFATEIEDFLDFSEGNPFGEISKSTGLSS
jgi:hypothetical protein